MQALIWKHYHVNYIIKDYVTLQRCLFRPLSFELSHRDIFKVLLMTEYLHNESLVTFTLHHKTRISNFTFILVNNRHKSVDKLWTAPFPMAAINIQPIARALIEYISGHSINLSHTFSDDHKSRLWCSQFRLHYIFIACQKCVTRVMIFPARKRRH